MADAIRRFIGNRLWLTPYAGSSVYGSRHTPLYWEPSMADAIRRFKRLWLTPYAALLETVYG